MDVLLPAIAIAGLVVVIVGLVSLRKTYLDAAATPAAKRLSLNVPRALVVGGRLGVVAGAFGIVAPLVSFLVLSALLVLGGLAYLGVQSPGRIRDWLFNYGLSFVALNVVLVAGATTFGL